MVVSEDLIARIFVQAADALTFCHARGVVHRDVKPDNMLMLLPPLERR
jgi:serine/threonine protein kinase